MDLPVWAGVIPLGLLVGEHQNAPELPGDATAPDYARTYTR
jgi:hypothetical protein